MSNNIMEKTIGQILDSFVTTILRTWMAQEQIMDKNLSDGERLQAAIRAQQQNAIRTELIRAIDTYFSDTDFTNVTKSYHTYEKDMKNQ